MPVAFNNTPLDFSGVNSALGGIYQNRLLKQNQALAGQAIGGDKNALLQLITRSPTEGAAIYAYQKDETKLKKDEAQKAALGSLISVLQSPEESRAQVYQQSIGKLKNGHPGMFDDAPDDYDPNYINEMVVNGASQEGSAGKLFQQLGAQYLGLPTSATSLTQLQRNLRDPDARAYLESQEKGGRNSSARLQQIQAQDGSLQTVVFDPKQASEYGHGIQNIGEPFKQANKQSAELPASGLKMQNEELDSISTASALKSDIESMKNSIDTGALKLGFTENYLNKGKNFFGLSDQDSRNLASFQATLERARNDSLRLNKGVQTDEDAKRAWNELLNNINDPKVVAQRLGEISLINDRAVKLHVQKLQGIRSNYKAEPIDLSEYINLPAAVGADKNTQQRTQSPQGFAPTPQQQPAQKILPRADIESRAASNGVTPEEYVKRAQAAGYQIQ